MNKTSLILWNVAKNPAPTDFMSGVDMAMANLEKPVSEPDIMLRSFAHNMVKLANNYKAHIPQGFYDLCLTLPRQVQELQTEALEIDFEEEYRIEVLTLCVSVAKKLDLACFCEEAILLFLPDGSIFPPEQAELWLNPQKTDDNKTKPVKFEKTITAYKKHLEPMISNMLEKYGFKFQPFDDPDFRHPAVDERLIIGKDTITDIDAYKKQKIQDLLSSKDSRQFCYVKSLDYGDVCIYFYVEEGKYNIYISPYFEFHIMTVNEILKYSRFNNFYWDFSVKAWRIVNGFENICREIEDDSSADDFLSFFEKNVLNEVLSKTANLEDLEMFLLDSNEVDTRWVQLLCLDHINGGVHADIFKDVGWYFASGIKKEDWSTEWPKLIEYVKQFKFPN